MIGYKFNSEIMRFSEKINSLIKKKYSHKNTSTAQPVYADEGFGVPSSKFVIFLFHLKMKRYCTKSLVSLRIHFYTYDKHNFYAIALKFQYLKITFYLLT